MPEVSVLMSVYNGETYLREAVDSILNQTFTDFEFIIVDDGSTDKTPAILDSYSDSRIMRLRNPQNIGLTNSLNRGLQAAQGRYIARMDADDIATPDRLIEQVTYLNSHPEIGLLSGNIILVDADGTPLQNGKPLYKHAATHHDLCWQLLWANTIPHMTVMLRKAVLDAHNLTYIPEYNTAEDHELWASLSRHTHLLRLDTVWAYHRRIATSVSHSRRTDQLATQYRVISRELCYLLRENLPESSLQTLFDVLYHEANSHQDFYGAAQLVCAAFQKFTQRPLAVEVYQHMQSDAVGYLLKISRRAYSRLQALYPLWMLHHISTREFASRNTLKMGIQIIFWGK